MTENIRHQFYTRQEDIFNPINQRFKIIVLGAGALGSFITLNLAKLGFDNITVWDFDNVVEGNIGAQFYRIKDIGKSKVEALKEIVKDFTDIDIEINNKEVTKDTELEFGSDILYVLTFDTLKNRKMFFEMTKDQKCFVIDARVGGEEYNIQSIDTFADEEVKKWTKSFDIIPTTLPCGAKSIIYTNLSVASEVCNVIKKMNNSESYPRKLIRHMKHYIIINDLKEGF